MTKQHSNSSSSQYSPKRLWTNKTPTSSTLNKNFSNLKENGIVENKLVSSTSSKSTQTYNNLNNENISSLLQKFYDLQNILPQSMIDNSDEIESYLVEMFNNQKECGGGGGSSSSSNKNNGNSSSTINKNKSTNSSSSNDNNSSGRAGGGGGGGGASSSSSHPTSSVVNKNKKSNIIKGLILHGDEEKFVTAADKIDEQLFPDVNFIKKQCSQKSNHASTSIITDEINDGLKNVKDFDEFIFVLIGHGEPFVARQMKWNLQDQYNDAIFMEQENRKRGGLRGRDFLKIILQNINQNTKHFKDTIRIMILWNCCHSKNQVLSMYDGAKRIQIKNRRPSVDLLWKEICEIPNGKRIIINHLCATSKDQRASESMCGTEDRYILSLLKPSSKRFCWIEDTTRIQIPSASIMVIERGRLSWYDPEHADIPSGPILYPLKSGETLQNITAHHRLDCAESIPAVSTPVPSFNDVHYELKKSAIFPPITHFGVWRNPPSVRSFKEIRSDIITTGSNLSVGFIYTFFSYIAKAENMTISQLERLPLDLVPPCFNWSVYKKSNDEEVKNYKQEGYYWDENSESYYLIGVNAIEKREFQGPYLSIQKTENNESLSIMDINTTFVIWKTSIGNNSIWKGTYLTAPSALKPSYGILAQHAVMEKYIQLITNSNRSITHGEYLRLFFWFGGFTDITQKLKKDLLTKIRSMLSSSQSSGNPQICGFRESSIRRMKIKYKAEEKIKNNERIVLDGMDIFRCMLGPELLKIEETILGESQD